MIQLLNLTLFHLKLQCKWRNSFTVTSLHRVQGHDGLVVGVEAALDGRDDDRGGHYSAAAAVENTVANLLRAPPQCTREHHFKR